MRALERSEPPTLFGNAKNQQMLIAMYTEGYVKRDAFNPLELLGKSGLVRVLIRKRAMHYALENRNPTYPLLTKVLAQLTGKAQAPFPDMLEEPVVPINPQAPLCHPGNLAFHVLLRLIEAKEPLDHIALTSRVLRATNLQVRDCLERLERDAVLVEQDGKYMVNPRVPTAYSKLVLQIAAHLAPDHPDIAFQTTVSTQRVSAFRNNSDGAARLFGTDLRLRNLMALAKYGSMHFGDLRTIIGGNSIRAEAGDYAPFGRGALVKTWETPQGRAVALDPMYPLAKPLRDLLLKLELTYPLPPLVRKYGVPQIPVSKTAWIGDKLALFGDDVPTSILLTLGARDWTFEALCSAIIPHDRVTVKKSMKRLEKEGVIVGDRPRKPGFNIRLVRVSPKFPAAAELLALLRAYVAVWPNIKKRLEAAMKSLEPRTQEQLRRRGLIPCECHPDGGHRKSQTAAYLKAQNERARARKTLKTQNARAV